MAAEQDSVPVGRLFLIGFVGIGRERHQMGGNQVDVVAIVIRENPLFLDENPVAQRCCAFGLERLGGGADVIAGAVKMARFKFDHAGAPFTGTFSFS